MHSQTTLSGVARTGRRLSQPAPASSTALSCWKGSARPSRLACRGERRASAPRPRRSIANAQANCPAAPGSPSSVDPAQECQQPPERAKEPQIVAVRSDQPAEQVPRQLPEDRAGQGGHQDFDRGSRARGTIVGSRRSGRSPAAAARHFRRSACRHGIDAVAHVRLGHTARHLERPGAPEQPQDCQIHDRHQDHRSVNRLSAVLR